MKSIFRLGLLFGCFVFFCASTAFSADSPLSLIPVGTDIEIIKDVRLGEPASGEIAEYVGYRKEGWLLFDEDGHMERESRDLPDGYVEWDPKTQDWSGTKTGISGDNPYFRLSDNSLITGAECYWKIVDEPLRKRFMGEAMEEMALVFEKVENYKKNKNPQ